jgi:carbonic anhydrase/acetyltransferase-like protein (isoleucine patch superfamily)
MDLSDRLYRYLGASPRIEAAAFVAPNATIVGDVSLGRDCGIWYGAVLRGDIQSIVIGQGTNIQDNAVVHLANEHGVKVGDYVTVGHGAIVHACEIGDETLIGMRATVLDGAVVGKNCLIGAHALVTQGTVIPDGSLAYGSPAKVVRPLSDEEKGKLRLMAEKYIEVARAHRALARKG